jgi:hypothetical protein
VELVVHPGVNTPDLESRYSEWGFNWSGERDALLSAQFAEAVSASGYTFAALAAKGSRTTPANQTTAQ